MKHIYVLVWTPGKVVLENVSVHDFILNIDVMRVDKRFLNYFFLLKTENVHI